MFRTHIRRRTDHLSISGEQRFFSKSLICRLGNAKVNYLGHRFAIVQRNHDIRWFDVAVNNALLMGMLDSIADLQKEVQTLLRAQFILVAVLRDGYALD